MGNCLITRRGGDTPIAKIKYDEKVTAYRCSGMLNAITNSSGTVSTRSGDETISKTCFSVKGQTVTILKAGKYRKFEVKNAEGTTTDETITYKANQTVAITTGFSFLMIYHLA